MHTYLLFLIYYPYQSLDIPSIASIEQKSFQTVIELMRVLLMWKNRLRNVILYYEEPYVIYHIRRIVTQFTHYITLIMTDIKLTLWCREIFESVTYEAQEGLGIMARRCNSHSTSEPLYSPGLLETIIRMVKTAKNWIKQTSNTVIKIKDKQTISRWEKRKADTVIVVTDGDTVEMQLATTENISIGSFFCSLGIPVRVLLLTPSSISFTLSSWYVNNTRDREKYRKDGVNDMKRQDNISLSRLWLLSIIMVCSCIHGWAWILYHYDAGSIDTVRIVILVTTTAVSGTNDDPGVW